MATGAATAGRGLAVKNAATGLAVKSAATGLAVKSATIGLAVKSATTELPVNDYLFRGATTWIPGCTASAETVCLLTYVSMRCSWEVAFKATTFKWSMTLTSVGTVPVNTLT